MKVEVPFKSGKFPAEAGAEANWFRAGNVVAPGVLPSMLRSYACKFTIFLPGEGFRRALRKPFRMKKWNSPFQYFSPEHLLIPWLNLFEDSRGFGVAVRKVPPAYEDGFTASLVFLLFGALSVHLSPRPVRSFFSTYIFV